MPRPDPSPWENPLTLRALVKRLVGLSGPYAEVHDAIVIGEFCEAFNVSLDEVSAQLETYCHSSPEGMN